MTQPNGAQEAMDGSPCEVEMSILYPGEEEPIYGGKIWFQCGPIPENGRNGVGIEDVIDVLVTRLEGFNNGPFRCRENSLAITHLQEAQNWLYKRTRTRQNQGVEGKNAPHV